MTNGSEPPGWYRDPTGQGDARYWNGTTWTEAVDRGGQRANLPIDPALARQQPVPGTQVQLPPTTTAYDREPQSGGPSGGVIIGLVIALLLVVAIAVAVDDSDSGEDSPPPGSEAPPATEAPAEPPADGG